MHRTNAWLLLVLLVAAAVVAKTTGRPEMTALSVALAVAAYRFANAVNDPAKAGHAMLYLFGVAFVVALQSEFAVSESHAVSGQVFRIVASFACAPILLGFVANWIVTAERPHEPEASP